MTAQRQILLASPREPSGGSWLINCLLELGVRVNFKPVIDRVWRSVHEMREASAMWEPAPGGGWRLHPRADALRKWLPVLSARERLDFRSDVAVFYVQDLPSADFHGDATALFVRDPRDAIHSYFQRVRPQMSLADFVAFPHPLTLFDAVAHWQLFIECWLARDGVRVYRFEDYKADAVALLSRIVADLQIDTTPAEVARAAAASSYEKARAAEALYRVSHPGDDEVAMRAGQVGEWKTGAPELDALSHDVATRMGPLLRRLGYEAPGAVAATGTAVVDGLAARLGLAAFAAIELPPGWREGAGTATPAQVQMHVQELLHRAATLEAGHIAQARLHAREARQLIDQLGAFAQAWQAPQHEHLARVRDAFENGAAYQMQRIGELARRLKARRAAAASARPEQTAAGSSADRPAPPDGG